MLGAAGPQDFTEWASWLGVPLWVGGLGLLAWLLLSGRLRRREDCAELIAARTAECDQLADRLAAVIADRDAWREAAREEADARQASDRAAAQLMDSTNLSVQLLQALQEAMRGRE